MLLPLIGLAALRLAPRSPARQAVLLAAFVLLTMGWNLGVQELAGGAVASKALPAYLGHFALGMLVALAVERGASSAPGAPRRSWPAASRSWCSPPTGTRRSRSGIRSGRSAQAHRGASASRS